MRKPVITVDQVRNVIAAVANRFEQIDQSAFSRPQAANHIRKMDAASIARIMNQAADIEAQASRKT